MAKRDVGFVDQHIEKIATAACVLILLAAAVFSFGGFRFSTNGRDPAALCEDVREQAEILTRRISNAKPPAPAGPRASFFCRRLLTSVLPRSLRIAVGVGAGPRRPIIQTPNRVRRVVSP